MKRLTLLALLLASTFSAVNAQTEEYITFGINGGVVHNINGYKTDPNYGVWLEDENGKKYYDGQSFGNGIPGYNIALDLGIKTSAKTRFRLEIEHEEIHYKVDWHNIPADSSIRIPFESKVKIWNMGINLRFDYKYLETEKWKLFVSPGLLWEFNINRETENHMRHYNNPMGRKYHDYTYKNYPYISDVYPQHILGGNVQFLCKYKIAKHIAITLIPEYYIYFRGFIKKNYGKPYQRLTMNAGLEFNF